MEFHAAYRLAGWTYPPPLLDYQWVGGFYESHPEWHCIDREGRNMPRMSYVYSPVQDYAISFLREVVASYDVEGVCLLYNRRPPYIDHEEPVIEGFKAEYGKDPARPGRARRAVVDVQGRHSSRRSCAGCARRWRRRAVSEVSVLT